MQGGFSIREYASRMRAINVVQCWPFDETFSEQTVKSLLPPIVVKRFTWWLDELHFLNSHSPENPQISSKLQSEKGQTSSSADSKQVKIKSLKGKMRATKKRSIVEIFAVAPPVGEADDEEEGDDDVNCNVGIKRASKSKKKKKKMKKTDAILRKAMRVVKKIKRKKAAEKRGNQIAVSDKENYLKLKLQTQETATGNSSLSCSKEVGNIRDFVSIPKRKPRQQDLGTYKKLVPCKSSKSSGNNQKPELPVRGILRHRFKEFSLMQSKKCILHEPVPLNNCSNQKSNKHVTFSEKGEVLRLSRKPSQSVECFKSQKDCCSDIGNVDYDVAAGKDSTMSETSGSEDAFTKAGTELGAGSATNEQLTTFSVDSNIFEKQKYEGEYGTRFGSSVRSAMHNVKHWSEHGLADAPQNTMDFRPPGFPHMSRDGYYNSLDPKLIKASSNNTRRRMNKDFQTPRPIFPPLSFEDYLRTHNDATVSHLSNMRRAHELTQDSSESTAINCARSIHFQSYPHLSPNENLQTFCSLPDEFQTRDIHRRSINGINEEFVGLPLNSQGELIALSSSDKREGNQMMNSSVSSAECISLSVPSNAVSKCSRHHLEYRNLDSQTSSTGQLNLFPLETYVKENATMAVLPSRLGIFESQSGKPNLDLDFLELNYHPLHNSEKTIFRGNDQVQKSPENEKFQSTMRLMGKEFEVGGRGAVQVFEDGRTWKDKQIVDELHFRNHFINGQSEPSFRQLRETLFCPSESNYTSPHFDCQASSTYKSVFLTRNVDCSQKLYPGLSPGTFSEVYNSKSLLTEPYTTGYDRELHFDMSPGATQLKNKQNLHYSPTPVIKFPFMHPDIDRHASSSWPRRSPVIQHPLCFDVSEMAAQSNNSQSSTLGRNHPYLNPVTNCGLNASVSFQPGDLCTFGPFSSGSDLQSVAPPPVPYYSGTLPVSAMQRKHNKIKERMKSRIGVRGSDTKSRGQVSPLLHTPFNTFKRSTLGLHEGHQCTVRNPAHVSFEDTFDNMEGAAFESCSATKNPRFVMSGEYDQTTKDGETILPMSDAYIETLSTGPVKLTAGSKHVLRPHNQKDHCTTRSTDEDISLPATNVDFRFPESENSAKIYQF